MCSHGSLSGPQARCSIMFCFTISCVHHLKIQQGKVFRWAYWMGRDAMRTQCLELQTSRWWFEPGDYLCLWDVYLSAICPMCDLSAIYVPCVTSKPYVPCVTSQPYVPCVTSQPYVPSVTSQSYVPGVTSQPYVPCVTSQSYVPDVAKLNKEFIH